MPSVAEFELPASTINAIGETRTRDDVELLVKVVLLNERARCANIASSIDSGRGNEKEIVRAILFPHETANT